VSSRTLILRPPRPRISLRVKWRIVIVSAALLMVGITAFALNIGYGEYPIAVGDVVATLLGAGDPENHFIVVELRLPRALVATLVGVALATSGTIFQTLVRNPLASPDIIGVTSGASLAGVAVFIMGASSSVVPLAAFGGALAASALVYALAWRSGLSPYRLVLVGIGIAAICAAGTSYLLVKGELNDVRRAAVWLVGSLNGRSWSELRPLALWLCVLVPASVALLRPLDAIGLGDDVARSLGVRVERVRLALVVVGAALAGAAVSAAGPVAFVAFVAPHIARRLVGVPGGAVLPVAALTGGALVLVADLAGRILLAPSEVPVGIITAMIGAPFFLYLLYRANRPA
jgi:ABC-type Fe3+-siderophore transport system permease subunit